jgi:Ca2+/Na+ antiporter
MAALLLLSIAAAGWYAAARTAADALSGGKVAPGRRALGQALCIAVVALFAVWIGHADLAIGVLFSTSVAALTLVLGIITISANHTHPTAPRRLWAFVLPVALILLVVGFRGSIGWMGAIVLLLEGAALLMLWNDPRLAQLPDAKGTFPVEPIAPVASEPKVVMRVIQLAIAMLSAIVASWAGVTAASHISGQLGLPGLGLVASLMLAPALVLSLIGAGTHAAAEGNFDRAASQLIALVLINLCGILPLTAMLWLARPAWHTRVDALVSREPQLPQVIATTGPTTVRAPATTAVADSSDESESSEAIFLYPMSVWRIDTILLIAAGLLLLPVALNRWTLTRAEGIGLVAAYVAYMVLTTMMAK